MRDRKGADPEERKVQKRRGRRTHNQDILHKRKIYLEQKEENKTKRTKV